MTVRARHLNRGLRKVCACARRTWAKCPHSWYFNFKLIGGPAYRFSVDSEAGKHIDNKTVAEALAETWRQQIRDGNFRRRYGGAPAPVAIESAAPAVLTLAGFADKYRERRSLKERDEACLRALLAFEHLATAPFASITADDIEAYIGAKRSAGLAASTVNKFVQQVRSMFTWATKKGYLSRNPLDAADGVKRQKHAKRSRRLEPTEEAALLAAAPAHLQRLIIAALETGCRRGELFSLRWRDVNVDRREITIRAENAKTDTTRHLPISARLAAVIEMAKLDPAGKAYEPQQFVFGELGRKLTTIKRAWETTVVKAAGHTPAWTKTKALCADSRAVYQKADLHFHDLRHEAGSRLLEAGWPLHHVQHMLGHTNLAQTSTYLNATRIGLRDSMRRLDGARDLSGRDGATAPGGGAISPPLQTVANERAIEQRPSLQHDDAQEAQALVN